MDDICIGIFPDEKRLGQGTFGSGMFRLRLPGWQTGSAYQWREQWWNVRQLSCWVCRSMTCNSFISLFNTHQTPPHRLWQVGRLCQVFLTTPTLTGRSTLPGLPSHTDADRSVDSVRSPTQQPVPSNLLLIALYKNPPSFNSKRGHFNKFS